jgi:hypothetical protein
MQIGAENRTKLIAAIVLMGLAVVLLGRFLFSGSESHSAAAPPPPETSATVTRVAAPRAATGAKASGALRSLDPTLRYDWLRVSEDTKYEGRGRNIFLAQAEVIPPPVAPAMTEKQIVDTGPPLPPPPPPINLKFYGFASKPGESKKVFLSKGEDVFIAAEGDIIDRRYKILRISPMAVEVEDVLNNNRQSLPLTQG